MTVHTRHDRSTTARPRTGRGGARGPRATASGTAARASDPPHARERAAGGPEDRARYHCQCGFVFEDAVTTSVGCPHCGRAQAW
jgi:hypothetical protein